MKKLFTLFAVLTATLVLSEAIYAQDATLITCAQAREYALSVSSNNEVYNNGALYAVEAYVTSIQTAWNSSYHNVSFWMADTDGGGNIIEAYRCVAQTEADAPKVGDRVRVTGMLTKYNSTPEFATGCTCEILTSSEAPKNLGHKTIAEFLSLKNTKDTCILTGVVENIVMDSSDPTLYNMYGNFDLVEIGNSDVKVYIYGLLTPDKQSKMFRTLAVDAGDTLTLKAVYSEYNGNPQAPNTIYVDHRDKITPVDPTKTEVSFATDFADGWGPWIGKTLHFLDTFYIHQVGDEPLAAYYRLRSPEEDGEEGTAAYSAAEARNANAQFTLMGYYGWSYDQGVYRTGTKFTDLYATVVAANQLQVTSDPTVIYANSFPTVRPDLGDANVVVCAANLENFFVTLGEYSGAPSTEERAERQRTKISSALYHMDADIYALCEVEQGPSAANALVNLLNNLADADRYDWVNAGFDSYSSIMVCFVYRKDKVRPVGNYIMPYTYAPMKFREAIQCFEHIASGEKVNIALNHFYAKLSKTDSDRQDNMQYLINKFSTATSNDPDILVVGDLNGYTNEESNLKLSRDRGYVDLLMKYDPTGYSYVYENLVGYLDHAYCSPSLESQVTKAVPYHLNADTDEWNYCYKSSNTSMYRYADHDPILIGLKLGAQGTGIENANGEEQGEWKKVLRNGQLIIVRGDAQYTVTGERIQ